MRALCQRVLRAAVDVDGERIAEIGSGLLVLVGVARDDDVATAEALARKVASLRLFGEGGAMERSLAEVGGEALVVSQFTLYGDTSKGRRPSFAKAAPREAAEPLVEAFAGALCALGLPVRTGRFGAHMAVELVNDGPVTVLVESRPV
jgi:D-tyrosyl-tRNA(Tyr) deacylase